MSIHFFFIFKKKIPTFKILVMYMLKYKTHDNIHIMHNNVYTMLKLIHFPRFNFFLPSWILQRSKFKVSDLTINCSLPLHHHPLSTFFDHSQLHTAVLEFLKSKNTAFSNLSALQGFHSFDTWAVYRSQGCLSDLHACVVIVASNYRELASFVHML